MDFLDDDFADFVEEVETPAQRRRDAKKEKLVQESLKEQYPKVKEFYPIYSDTPDAWQADLTFFWEKAEQYVDIKKPPPKTPNNS